MTDFEQKKLTQQERNALRAQKKEQDRLAKIKAIPESIHGIPVIETEYTSVPNKRVKALRREFSQVRKEFLKMLAETQVPALKQMGLSDKAIEGMALTGKGHASHTAAMMGLSGIEPDKADPDVLQNVLNDIRSRQQILFLGKYERPFIEKRDITMHYNEVLPGHPFRRRKAAKASQAGKPLTASLK